MICRKCCIILNSQFQLPVISWQLLLEISSAGPFLFCYVNKFCNILLHYIDIFCFFLIQRDKHYLCCNLLFDVIFCRVYMIFLKRQGLICTDKLWQLYRKYVGQMFPKLLHCDVSHCWQSLAPNYETRVDHKRMCRTYCTACVSGTLVQGQKCGLKVKWLMLQPTNLLR